jgi:hypothetical protein
VDSFSVIATVTESIEIRAEFFERFRSNKLITVQSTVLQRIRFHALAQKNLSDIPVTQKMKERKQKSGACIFLPTIYRLYPFMFVLKQYIKH